MVLSLFSSTTVFDFFVLGGFSLPPNPPQTFFENARTKLNHSLSAVGHHSFLFLENKKNKFSFILGGEGWKMNHLLPPKAFVFFL